MAFFEWLETLSFSQWVRESGSLWAFPMFLFSHTLGMALVAGGSTLQSFAFLGLWPKAPITPLEKLRQIDGDLDAHLRLARRQIEAAA